MVNCNVLKKLGLSPLLEKMRITIPARNQGSARDLIPNVGSGGLNEEERPRGAKKKPNRVLVGSAYRDLFVSHESNWGEERRFCQTGLLKSAAK